MRALWKLTWLEIKIFVREPLGLFGTIGIPVVGAGGITSGHDAVEFLMAGARAVEVGTASLYDPNGVARIAGEIAGVLERLGETSVEKVIGTLAA